MAREWSLLEKNASLIAAKIFFGKRHPNPPELDQLETLRPQVWFWQAAKNEILGGIECLIDEVRQFPGRRL